MARQGPRLRPVTRDEARQFVHKADEYLAAARHSLVEGATSAAAGNAVHAGINAVDAILGARTGSRSAGQDHGQAAMLVVAVPDLGAEAAKLIRRLLPLKSRAEYDPAPVSTADAARAVETATKLVDLARRTV